MSCSRLNRGANRLSCTAFPAGVPDAIWKSQVDHRKPFEGDHGLQFEQDPSKPAPNWAIVEHAAAQA
jgi:hypothetical protein